MATDTLKRLRSGHHIFIEGVEVVMDGDGHPTRQGEWYVAERNTGPKLLTVFKFGFYQDYEAPVEHRVEIGPEDHPSWIVPYEMAYSFNYSECVKVKVIGLG